MSLAMAVRAQKIAFRQFGRQLFVAGLLVASKLKLFRARLPVVKLKSGDALAVRAARALADMVEWAGIEPATN